MMHGSIMFHIHQKFNLVDRLIFMGTIFTILLSNILSFNSLILITMMKIMTSKLAVVLAMQITFRIMSTIFSHLNLFKYKNMIFNIKSVTKIHYDPSLFGYLMTSLNRNL